MSAASFSRHGSLGSWCVVSTIRAPSYMTNFFIRHYLAIGCNELHIFFDDPDFCEIDEELRLHERVSVYICDDDYWSGQRTEYPRESAVRAKNIEGRQYANYMKVQRETSCAWLLNIDVDEIVFPRVRVNELLESVPGNIFLLALKPFEAVYEELPVGESTFNTKYFKSLIYPHKNVIEAIYREALLPHKYGFWGHNRGKGFFRTAEPLRYLSCHFPKPVNRNLVENIYTRDIDLLHFESMTFDLFLEKRVRRLTKKTYAKGISHLTKQRLAAFDTVYQKEGEVGALRMYCEMNVFGAERMKMALDDGFVVVRDVESLAGMQKQLGGELLLTKRGRPVIYDLVSGFARESVEGDEFSVVPLKLYREPGSSGRGYLASKVRAGYRYFFPDEKGRLVAYAGGECHLFDVREAAEGVVTLSWSGLHITLDESGKLFCMAGGGDSCGGFVVRD